jgi:preprotein translocase subunit SecB
MSNNENTPQSLRVIAQYLKDSSFENPGQGSLARIQGTQPDININIQVNTAVDTADKRLKCVDIIFKAVSTIQTKPLFILEITYTGIFEMIGFKAEIEEQIMNIQCPALLFPFIRKIISDQTVDGGYPPLLIDPIDFHALYVQNKQNAEKQANQKTEAPASEKTTADDSVKIILN